MYFLLQDDRKIVKFLFEPFNPKNQIDFIF